MQITYQDRFEKADHMALNLEIVANGLTLTVKKGSFIGPPIGDEPYHGNNAPGTLYSLTEDEEFTITPGDRALLLLAFVVVDTTTKEMRVLVDTTDAESPHLTDPWDLKPYRAMTKLFMMTVPANAPSLDSAMINISRILPPPVQE